MLLHELIYRMREEKIQVRVNQENKCKNKVASFLRTKYNQFPLRNISKQDEERVKKKDETVYEYKSMFKNHYHHVHFVITLVCLVLFPLL